MRHLGTVPHFRFALALLVFSTLALAPRATGASERGHDRAWRERPWARCVAPPRSEHAPLRTGECISLLPAPGTSPLLVPGAVRRWRACSQYGSGFPTLESTPGCLRSIEIDFVPGSSGARHCGTFRGRRIEVFERAVGRDGRETSCGDPELVLAHELGHVLGLGDVPAGAGCRSHVMAAARPWREPERAVQPAECELADASWSLPSE